MKFFSNMSLEDYVSSFCPLDFIYKIGQAFYLLSNPEENHSYRYMHFIETSEDGLECKYARLTNNLFFTSGQAARTMKTVYQVRDLLTEVIEYYEGVIRQHDNKET